MIDSRRITCATLLFIALTPDTAAQSFESSPFDQPFSSPPREQESPADRLRLELVTELPLPGPLPESQLRVIDDRVEIPVAGGLAVTAWHPGADLEIREDVSPKNPPVDGWGVGPEGLVRARSEPPDRFVAEKTRKRGKARWKRKWRLRVAGASAAPPLVTETRIYFGTMANRVYSLRRRNGHRVWTTDVGSRVAQPLVLWKGHPGRLGAVAETDTAGTSGREENCGSPEGAVDAGASAERPTAEIGLILVLPDTGSQLLALDARTGQPLADYTLDEGGGRLVGIPVITDDGLILVSRQKYRTDEASLLVLQFVRAGTPESEDPADAAAAAPPTEAPEPRTDPPPRKARDKS